MPATSAQGDFLDVLGQGGVDAGNLLGSLVTLLRAAKPPHAYEVKGVLMRGSGKQSYGVTLQVTRLPTDAIRVETLWDTSWVRVLRRAADHATAAILTRTRRCESPWAAWRRYPMPGELFHDYERAAELEDERRYDEALDRYYRALEHDPLNLGLRLQIGFLQEKIGLPLDALATYEGMEAVEEPGGVPLPRRPVPQRLPDRARRGDGHRPLPARRAAGPGRAGPAMAAHRPAGRGTPGRAATASGATCGAASSPRWLKLFEPIARLAADRAHPAGRAHRGAAFRAHRDRADRALLELQELLQLAACRRGPRVAQAGRAARGRPRGTTLTPRAAELSECCMEQRLAWTQAALAAEPDVVEHPTAADVRDRLARYARAVASATGRSSTTPPAPTRCRSSRSPNGTRGADDERAAPSWPRRP